MKILANDIFYKFIVQRLPFTGILDAYKKGHHKHYRHPYHRTLILENVLWQGELFRNHVHIAGQQRSLE